jgi:hypothetical protein
MIEVLILKLESAIESAQKLATIARLNKHFFTPQTVSSVFTGRENELELMKRHLITGASKNLSIQKRFVVYGLAGSGKTQFCCKFASDNRQRYCLADGSTRDSLLIFVASGAYSGLMPVPKSTQNSHSLLYQRLVKFLQIKLP